jgi:rhamnulokinase
VLSGPVEATAIGNVLVQARAQGFATGSLESLRSLVRQAFPPRSYQPTPSGSVLHDNISP